MNIRRRRGLEKEISKIIAGTIIFDVKNEIVKKYVSISKVILSNDARYADVYISMLLENEKIKKENLLEEVNKLKGFFRKKVGESLDIRFTPELRFHFDDSMEYSVKISSILNKLKVKED